MNRPYLTALVILVQLFLLHASVRAQLSIDLNGIPPLCGGFSTGSVLATVTGGQPPYQFEWSNGETGNPITGLSAGLYSLTVTDQDGNEATDSIELIAPPPLNVPITVTACSPPGAMTATPTGGTPPYSISWNTGDTTASISGLPLGQYCITVQDDNNCAFINCQYIGEPMTDSIATTPAACNNPVGGGTAAVTVSGGVPPFTYEWDNGMSGALIDSLPAGPVTVTVTAYNGCSIVATDTVGLEENPLGVQLQTQEPGCAGDSTGWAMAEVPGAFLPASYLWNTGDSTQSVSNLPAGTYSVTVTDAMGCTGSKTFQLDNASNLTVTLEVEQPTCHGSNNGRIKVHPFDGVPPFTYKWNTGDSTQYLENLAPGLYSVTVTDDAGCNKVDSVTLIAPPPLQDSLFVKNASHCAAKDGSITPIVNGGGNWPFTFSWSTGSTDSILVNVGAGSYIVTITSAEGCQVVDTAEVAQPNTLMVNVSGTSLVCGNENKGMLNASVQYGSAPYQYQWNNGATTPNIHNLGPGVYSVTVTSAEGCSGQASKTIFSSPAISFTSQVDSISCYGANDGSISIEAQGGLAPISFQWSNGSTAPKLLGLSGGFYEVTITDIAGCSTSGNFQLVEPQELVASILSDAGTCDSDAEMQAVANGGVGPFTYLWSTGSNEPTITSSTGGNFSVAITDAHGCSDSETIFLPEIPGIQLDIFGTGTSCFGKNDGTIVAIASEGTPPFQYDWSNGATGNGIGNLPAGTYSVTVTDQLGCIQTASYTVVEGPALQIDIVAPQFSCAGSPVIATVNPSASAVHPLSFEWSNGLQTQVATGLEAGTYWVTMTDALGCQGIDSTTILAGGDFTASISKTDIHCFGQADGMVSVSTSGGIQPLQIEWNTGATGSTLAQLEPGVYTATITEAVSGCSQSLSSEIVEPEKLLVQTMTQNGLCGAPASASLNITGGVQPWSVLWNTGDTTTTLETSIAGPHSFVVTDANGCSEAGAVQLEVAPPPNAEIALLSYPSSPLLPDGVLAVSYSNFEQPIEILWSNNSAADTLTGLAPGNYSVTISDANDCELIRHFEIPAFAELGDFVWFDENENGIQDQGEEGIDSVTVQVNGVNFLGENSTKTTKTESSGHYHFYLPPGDYKVHFQLLPGYEFTANNMGGDSTADSDADPQTGESSTVSLQAGETRLDLDAGFIAVDTCQNVTTAGEICCDHLLCVPGDSPVELAESQAASGGSGDLNYQWFQNQEDQPFDVQTWQLISGANSATLTALPTETTYYVRTARRSGCAVSLPSNRVKITVLNDIQEFEVLGPATICEETAYSFEISNPSPDAQYIWSFSETASPSFVSGSLVPAVSWLSTDEAWVVLTTTEGMCTLIDTMDFGASKACTEGQILLHGKVAGEDALLTWQWPSDSLAGLQFELEWSFASAPYSSIATIDSSYTLNDSTHFQHLHIAPPSGKNYYRLKLTGANGYTWLSNVVELNFEANGNLVIAYPNPFANELALEIVESYNSEISYTLFDALGRKWLEGNFEENESLRILETEDLVSGFYFLAIRYNGALFKVIRLVRR